eukprot:6386588-Amphidinium_carterae.1
MFCQQVRARAMEHQERVIAEARNLSQHAANERNELLQSCQRKAEETVNLLRNQLDREKAQVQEIVDRHLAEQHEKRVREAKVSQDAMAGQLRSQLEEMDRRLETNFSGKGLLHATVGIREASRGVSTAVGWTNQAPPGYDDYVAEVADSPTDGVHMVPPFANDIATPPGLQLNG